MLAGMKHKAVLGLGLLLLALVVACGGTSEPAPDIEATVQARLVEERAAEATVEAKAQVMAKAMVEATAQAVPMATVNPPSQPEPSAEPEITQAGAALLLAIAKWHLRWGTPGLNAYEHEDMVSELMDLTEPAGNLLEEPLALRIDNYTFTHMLFTMVDSNTAYRAAVFAIDSGLGDSMPTPCSLPVANAVPEELQQDSSLLSVECLTLELFETYLSQTRSLAAKTWLRPFIDR